MDKNKKGNSTKKKVGKYIVDHSNRLGVGSYGQVFMAQSQPTKEIVAVKVIKKKDITEDSYTKAALIREIQIMKQLKSPFIIEFLQISETSNNIYIFQELANQGTLEDLLNQCHRLSEQQALKYIEQILTGFSELIKNGIIHRDIKTSNILMKKKMVKIADFGLSRYSSNRSFMMSYVGTPFYMSPQILKQQQYSYKCDIWSLGLVFYQLVVGNLPWKISKEGGINELLKQIEKQCEKSIEFPRNIQISIQFKNLVNGCLKYKQSNRFDWDQIFSHKIFNGKFKQIWKSTQNFTLTSIRLKTHSNNLNLNKLISELPQQIRQNDFYLILKTINDEINEKEAQNLFKIISNSKDALDLLDMKRYLQNRGVKFSGFKNKPDQQSQKRQIQILEKVALSIQKQKIDLFDLYQQFKQKKQERLSKGQFEELMKALCNQLNAIQIDTLMFRFNGQEHLSCVIFIHAYEELCKAAQLPAYKDENISRQMKNLQKRKL